MRPGGIFLISISIFFVALACFHHSRKAKPFELDECDPTAIKKAAAALGWPSVDAYKKHLLTERGGRSACIPLAKTTSQAQQGFFDYLSTIFDGDDRSRPLDPSGQIALAHGQKRVFSASQPSSQARPPSTKETETIDQPGEKRKNSDMLRDDAGTIAMDHPSHSNEDAHGEKLEHGLQPNEQTHTQQEGRKDGAIKREDRELRTLSKESPKTITKAVDALQAEAAALGYVVEPAPSLALEAQKLVSLTSLRQFCIPLLRAVPQNECVMCMCMNACMCMCV
jgi:hypothetical protein